MLAEGGEPDRKAEPGSRLSQWWTVLRVLYDVRTKPRHVSVMMTIVQAFRRDFGNGRASISYIKRATRLNDRTVVKTCRELAAWRMAERHVVSGRTTEYVPSWATAKPYPASVGFAGGENTSDYFATVKNAGGTSAVFAGGLCPTSCTFDSESYLLLPADSKTDGNSREVSAPASGVAVPASPSDAGSKAQTVPPAGTGGSIPQAFKLDDFERCWKAYGKLGSKKASRVAFAIIQNPDVDQIAERAASWATSAKGKRMPFEKWLIEERYDEADRRAGQPHASGPDEVEGDDMARTTKADRHRAELKRPNRQMRTPSRNGVRAFAVRCHSASPSWQMLARLSKRSTGPSASSCRPVMAK